MYLHTISMEYYLHLCSTTYCYMMIYRIQSESICFSNDYFDITPALQFFKTTTSVHLSIQHIFYQTIQVTTMTDMKRVLIYGGKTGWIGGLMGDLVKKEGLCVKMDDV